MGSLTTRVRGLGKVALGPGQRLWAVTVPGDQFGTLHVDPCDARHDRAAMLLLPGGQGVQLVAVPYSTSRN